MSNASWALGSVLTRALNPIAEIVNIVGPDPTMDTIDVTNLSSPNGVREFIPTLQDMGEVTLEGNFYPGDTLGQIGLKTDYDNRTLQAFVLTFPAATGTNVAFNAYVTRPLGLGAPVDGKIPFAATLKISGTITVNVTASNNVTVLTGVEETGLGALDFVPNFLATVYTYNVLVDTATTWITVNATFAAGVGSVVCLGVTQSLTSTVDSGHIVIGAANSLTDVIITVKETNKIAKTYTIHVARP